MMTPELQRYYEARISLMSGEGWNDLKEDVRKMYDTTNDITPIQNADVLHFRRGELSIMRWLLSLKESSENSFEILKGEDEGS